LSGGAGRFAARPKTLRDNLVPLNKKYPIAELLEACTRYQSSAPRDFITFEYCMLDGVNDQPEHARQLVSLVQAHGAQGPVLQIQPDSLQSLSGLRPEAFRHAASSAFAKILMDAGIVTTVGKPAAMTSMRPAGNSRAMCRIARAWISAWQRNGKVCSGESRSLWPRGWVYEVFLQCDLGAGLLAGRAAGGVCQSARPAPGASRQSGARNDIVTESDEPDGRRRARLRLELASGYFEQGQTNVASDEIKQSLVTDPTFGDAYNLRGLVYMRLNDMAMAEDSFRRALALNPRDADAAHNYGWLMCQQGRYNDADGFFARPWPIPHTAAQPKR
jgi:tetratricopeptide (TPR) repeat protein